MSWCHEQEQRIIDQTSDARNLTIPPLFPRYEPSTGYVWDFDHGSVDFDDENELLRRIHRERKNKLTRINTDTDTEYNDEYIQASEAMDRILARLNERKATWW